MAKDVEHYLKGLSATKWTIPKINNTSGAILGSVKKLYFGCKHPCVYATPSSVPYQASKYQRTVTIVTLLVTESHLLYLLMMHRSSNAGGSDCQLDRT